MFTNNKLSLLTTYGNNRNIHILFLNTELIADY